MKDRKKERQKKRWLDVLGSDMKKASVCEEGTGDRVKWKLSTSRDDPE